MFSLSTDPLWWRQDDARVRLDREHDARLEAIHAQELELRELQTWLKAQKVIPGH